MGGLLSVDLMTGNLESEFAKYPLYSQDGKGENAQVVVKYFYALGSATWLITEGEKQDDGDWLFFGYCTIDGILWEWGYVTLRELESVPFIERDLYTKMKTIKELKY